MEGAPAPPILLAPTLGPVEVGEVIGRGQLATVFAATTRGGVRVALKISQEPEALEDLGLEAQRLLIAESPRLPQILDVGVLTAPLTVGTTRFRPGAGYLALSWCDGVPLTQRRYSGQTDDEVSLLRLIEQLAAALEHLHAVGIAHGDVKPDNVLISGAGRETVVHLLDLGLAAELDRTAPRGGTPQYLAPEVFDAAGATWSAARDLWAFGLTVAGWVYPELLEAEAPAQALRSIATAPSVLRDLIVPLLAPQPGARPSAAWVRRRAVIALGERPMNSPEYRRARVKRSYLSLRSRELAEAARHHEVQLDLGGEPRRWVEHTLGILRAIEGTRGRGLIEAPWRFVDLESLEQQRWLVKLVGPAAAHWPAHEAVSDSVLVGYVLRAVERVDPECLVYRDLLRVSSGVAAAQSTGEVADTAAPGIDAVSLALRLGDTPVEAAVLRSIEECDELDAGMVVSTASAMRLRGELGRALALLGEHNDNECEVERADIERRTGAKQQARERLQGLLDRPLQDTLRSRAVALLARIRLDEGEIEASLELTHGQVPSAALLEVRALAELQAGRIDEARGAAERARALVRTEEEHARVAGVEGLLAHAAQAWPRAYERFGRAAEHAERAGAVLEEATYLTGVAAAATNLGYFQEALQASERSMLLFEYLGNRQAAARALLSRASVFAALGALQETDEAAQEALRAATLAGDRLCQAYAHLALSEARPEGSREGKEHAERAQQLLAETSEADRLRAAALRLWHLEAVDVEQLDLCAKAPAMDRDARLSWWRARAQDLKRRAEQQGAEQVLSELAQLGSEPAPVAAKGQAMATGVELALQLGDGQSARRFMSIAAELARELLGRVSGNLLRLAEGLPWVVLSQSREPGFMPEQLSDVENLVRALGHRATLRPLLDQVLDALVLWTGVERGLLLLKAPGGRLVVRAARNLARGDLSAEQLELSHSLAERALKERAPFVAVDAATELSEKHVSVHALKLRSVLALPLINRGEVLGVVYLDDRERRGAFGERELAWVRLVGTLAAVAIADARDQLLLRRAARKARRAEQRATMILAKREAELEVAERQLARDRRERGTRFAYESIIGHSSAVEHMLSVVDRVTTADVPVLIVGESGSGKELVARSIHANGSRGEAAFVSENCAAIPETLLESTLFGHVRGAFTGASRARVGLFEAADGGTLFLDEIGEMSLGMQAKLLRVLETGDVRAVGSERARRVDVRVIAATHRNLAEMVQQKAFREDLLYRLNVITIPVPALREREGDLDLLVHHFIRVHAPTRHIEIEPSAMAALRSYAWPGNVRQLENEVRRFLVLADGRIGLPHLSAQIVGSAEQSSIEEGLNLRRRVDALEADLVRQALDKTRGNQTRAAELLGLSRFGLQKMIKRLGIASPRASGRRAEDTLSVSR